MRVLAWIVVFMLVVAQASASDKFLVGLEDVPLMPGLVQLADQGVVFDAPSGRIAELYAAGRVAREDVRGFYARTLPQLGWQADGADRFLRDGETLRLEFPTTPTGIGSRELVVRFYLFPG
jgi:hypothetical protein